MVLGRGRVQREWVLEISFLVSCFLLIDVLHVLLREMEAEEEVVGVEGILSGLERERNLFYGLGSSEKRVNGKASWKDGGDDGAHSEERISEDYRGTSTMPICSFQRDGNPETEFEAAEFVPNEEGNGNHNFNDNISVEGKEVTQSGSKFGEESRDTCSDTEEICQNQMHLHLKHLESELTSALHLLRSRSKGSDSYKSIVQDQISSLKELPMLSDELEFKQAEIMNAKDKLRSLCAKSVIQQGKMTHAIIEARNERKKRLDASLKHLRLLRSTCIIWRGFATEVHLAGSFDGWTSQKTMERSSSGMFTLHLKLYPGRYEIKFIVDGVWMIDPLRPTVFNNSYENNLLIIP
ncbi:uncharacterized protein A4U43_C07F35740 [Asparagus officinalis]|uniref:AMP-activated protein kinase glycogen-binding domain-containing protein n=1 Tax=Asparagus officinalis TaxID=4686 RepID=A0A5P1EHT3_ASPOF|nr:uncharacterized protein A4U43_C07F35740 [Asparagus officinalis]